jgi:hypothetical protein
MNPVRRYVPEPMELFIVITFQSYMALAASRADMPLLFTGIFFFGYVFLMCLAILGRGEVGRRGCLVRCLVLTVLWIPGTWYVARAGR